MTHPRAPITPDMTKSQTVMAPPDPEAAAAMGETATQAQLRGLVHAAGEQPGRLVTGYSPDDRQALQKLAADHRRQADQLDQAAREIR